jgi:aminomuconate-semialdehyde/2-hydroxymuconate-6-semialdehyde dehydrogenase
MREIDCFIDGEYVSTSDRFDDFNPATGALTARVALAGADEVDRAVQAARRALSGPWGKMSAVERADLLAKVADEIDRRKEDFLRAEIDDTGKPVGLASKIDIPRGAANFRVFADMLRAEKSESFEQRTPDGGDAIHYVIRRPLGVVGVICPWNLPLLLMTWKVAPALAAGNTVVVKPSEETPQTAALLGEVMNAVGVPRGVYNVVHGFGPGGCGEAMVTHPGIRAITFTGESRTGMAIQKASAPWVKPLSFELGGKNPALVFADCDLDKAVAGTVRSVFANCGQVCLCSERVYVQRPIFDEFVARLKEGAENLVTGDPWSSETTMGPLISKQHREKVLSYYALGRDEGAEVITGGVAVGGDGYFVKPSIYAGLGDDARFVREEIFGPVCHVSSFDDEDEVIARANDTDYGLCAAIWTEGLSRAHRVAHQMETGIVWVNDWFLRDLRTPFGGAKLSGVGREGGHYSFEFYSELKNICVKL